MALCGVRERIDNVLIEINSLKFRFCAVIKRRRGVSSVTLQRKLSKPENHFI